MIELDKIIIKRSLLIKKEQIEPNPWNPNVTTRREQNAIQESLEAFGQIANVLVREVGKGKYQIIDGEHRFKELPEAMYCDVVKLNDADAKRLTIITNEGGNPDKALLAELLQDIAQDMTIEEMMVGLPYDDKTLEDLLDYETDFSNYESFSSDDDSNPLDLTPKMGRSQEINTDEFSFQHTCPKCKFQYND
jgi:hypothetical protein